MADFVLTAGAVCFSLALLPMVFGKSKAPASSSALTAFWLWAFAGVYASRGWTFATISTCVTAFLWTVVFAQGTTDVR